MSDSEYLRPGEATPRPGSSATHTDFGVRRAGHLRRFAARTGRLGTALADACRREMEEGRGFLWLPVCFSLGILFYFVLPREPSAVALWAIAIGLALCAWWSRQRIGLCRILTAIAFAAAGATAMKLRTDWVAAPKLPREMVAEITGWVGELEMTRGGGIRIAVRVAEIEELAPAETPRIVRVTIRSDADAISVGDAIAVLARIRPPNGPVIPGGYDFARAAYYEGIGGVGFAFGAAKPAALGPPPLSIRAIEPLARLREGIRERVTTALPGDPGRIAAALVIGDRGGISEATEQAMYESGLGHILAISGLHMVLIAGSAFWVIRALLALSPELALRRPIKKWAALGALAVATFYLAISGAQVATQRAYVMLAIMLLAVLIDRRAITLRNVALAAFVVLLIAPESLLSASFQMSFAATVALVAGYEAISARLDAAPRLSNWQPPGVLGLVWRFTAGLFVTSLIAGLATLPFGIYHFQRLAPLTLLANLLAMPAVGFVVMPMVLLSVVLMPLGLEVLPLTVMSWGVDWVIRVAEWTAELSGEAGGVRMVPALSLALVVAGFLWLSLWRERWRLLGLVPVLAAVPIALLAPWPDVLVSGEGTTAAVRGAEGRLAMIAGRGSRFTIENWLRADADPREPDTEDLSIGVLCDPIGCVGTGVHGLKLALVLKYEAFTEDCRLATIVVSRLDSPNRCGESTIVIDRERLARYGAHALYRMGSSGTDPPRFRVETAYPEIARPWMPAFNSGG